MRIIGICGYKQSGKSVASKYLIEKHGYKPHNFKDALIKELKDNFPDLLEQIRLDCEHQKPYLMFEPEGQWTIERLFEEKPPLVRKLMQNYATEVRRKEYPDYWINKWNISRPIGNIVVDDVRFLNESETVKRYGGIIIKIIRTGQVSNDLHSSETEHTQIIPDYTIEANEGDHEAIYYQIDNILKQI